MINITNRNKNQHNNLQEQLFNINGTVISKPLKVKIIITKPYQQLHSSDSILISIPIILLITESTW